VRAAATPADDKQRDPQEGGSNTADRGPRLAATSSVDASSPQAVDVEIPGARGALDRVDQVDERCRAALSSRMAGAMSDMATRPASGRSMTWSDRGWVRLREISRQPSPYRRRRSRRLCYILDVIMDDRGARGDTGSGRRPIRRRDRDIWGWRLLCAVQRHLDDCGPISCLPVRRCRSDAWDGEVRQSLRAIGPTSLHLSGRSSSPI